MLEDHLSLPSNGKLYSKVISWVQRSLWENGEPLERLMEEVSTAVLFEFSQFSPFLILPSFFQSPRVCLHKAHTHPTGFVFFFLYSIFFVVPLLFLPYHNPPPLPSPQVFKSIYFAIGTVLGCYTLCKGKRLVQVSRIKKKKPPVWALCHTVKLKVTESLFLSHRCLFLF